MNNYLDLTEQNINYDLLKKPSEIIRSGGIVVFPTETVYGIGTNGLDKNAIENLYKVKQRPFSKPINLLISSIDMVKLIAKDISDAEYKLMEHFFPGPLTIILKKNDIVPDILTAGGDTVGVRMPDCDIALNLIKLAGVPIATPSANISQMPSATNIKNAMNYFQDKVDLYIDGGESKLKTASTIVQVIDNVPLILRVGSITEEEIKKVIKS